MTERYSGDASARDLTLEVYRRLMSAFGPQGWWPGAEEPLEVCIGAILAQNTAWRNAERALARLKGRRGHVRHGPLRPCPPTSLTELLRPSGTFRSKSLTVQAFVAHLGERYQGDLARMLARPMDALRAEMLGIRGIGPETADDILLYAAGRPSFVVDACTRAASSRASACTWSATATSRGEPTSWTAYPPTSRCSTSTTRCSCVWAAACA